MLQQSGFHGIMDLIDQANNGSQAYKKVKKAYATG